MNLYFDNGATSFPKPPEVEAAAISAIRRGGNYGRSSYNRSVENVRIVEACRDKIGEVMGLNGDQITFTKNSTEAANLILRGLKLKNKRVLVSGMEHNAVMRPLTFEGAKIEVVKSHRDGSVDLESLKNVDFSDVELFCINHVSNVNGVIQPLDKIIEIARGTKIFIDGSQSIGVVDPPKDVDFIIFTGHKSLFGPIGIGGAYIKEPQTITPLIYGGTGSNSDSFEMPNFMPDRFEAGSPNIMGAEMLLAALEHKPKPLHSRKEFENFVEKIKKIETLQFFGASNIEMQTELFSIKSTKISVASIAQELWDRYKIEIRKGLHCSPLAHKTISTFSEGTVRLALSPYHTNNDLDFVYNALKEILEERK